MTAAAPRARRAATIGTVLACLLLALTGCGEQSAGSEDRESSRSAERRMEGDGGRRAEPRMTGRVSTRRAARAVERFRRTGRAVYCGAGRRPYVALTFDDGPGPATLETIRLLRRYRARATFFVLGQYAKEMRDVLASEAAVGGLGVHTWTHPDLTELGPGDVRWEIGSTHELLRRTRARIDTFRPPYGERDARVDRAARRRGLLTVMWNVDSTDSHGDVGVERVVRAVLDRVRAGSIVLMHENQEETLPALRRILPVLRRRGLRMVSVPELLALDPPDRWQLRRSGRGCRPRANVP